MQAESTHKKRIVLWVLLPSEVFEWMTWGINWDSFLSLILFLPFFLFKQDFWASVKLNSVHEGKKLSISWIYLILFLQRTWWVLCRQTNIEGTVFSFKEHGGWEGETQFTVWNLFFFLICLDGSWQLSLYFSSVHRQWNVWETNTLKILICIWKIMVWKGAKGLGQDKFILSFTHSIDKFAVFALLPPTSWLPRGWH